MLIQVSNVTQVTEALRVIDYDESGNNHRFNLEQRCLKMKVFRITGLLLLSVMLLAPLASCASPTSSETTANGTSTAVISLISPADARTMLDGESDAYLLDVRTQDEFDQGHIPGSALLPYDEIQARADELPADKAMPIIVYCRSGRRSAIAAESLKALGYTEIYDLGGIQDWPYETVAP